ncbi:S-adenosyl-L-methionine-dependent methyltransferase [Gonapodya prolifera JEL478]|uniref:sphingolipid C(9)-methyltransferase n=1 Tax=Gonapodya prolifera (strain JEL478) TaxID=1344416 RepID=A0A139ADD6_GONPJ|nr:S-adenosyl-L-methionine-dependent methyltransferase [Gonapodya prolifera JEL478]|eukprot:KXS14433.1 S-adenosyl-L-methionine-dependent methyltransferase [Gonapodya prolifera JEL478]
MPLTPGKEPYWATHDGRKVVSVHEPPYPVEGHGNDTFSNLSLATAILGVAAPIPVLLDLPFTTLPTILAVTAAPTFVVYNYARAWIYGNYVATDDSKAPLPKKPIEEYLEFKDPALKRRFGGSKIPMELFFENYMDGKIDIKGDVLDVLEHRHDWAVFRFSLGQATFLVSQWVPELLWHSKKQDETQVGENYDRGNDFYNAFLGPTMTYTSGVVVDKTRKETLEELQRNKYDLVLRKTLFDRPGLKHLDIGCGWGPLVIHAAKHFKTAESVGVTLAKNQVSWGNDWAAREGVSDVARLEVMDYRDIPTKYPGKKWDRITCLEMAEHVGVLRFQTFLRQIYDTLEDDGVFYMQVAGLRRTWQYEDFIWGLFMAKYIFPGADASTPLNWYLEQLERAGFEVQSTETMGTHYSATLWRWYENWLSNRGSMVKAYGEKMARLWEIFLAWSTIIARQGSATVYFIVAHKNKNGFDRTRFMPPRA